MRWTHVTLLAGRLLFGGFFGYHALDHLVLSTGALTKSAAAAGVPFAPAAVLGTGLLLFIGSASVLLGLHPRVGLACLMIFLVGVTPIMHNFWAVTDPLIRAFQMGSFLQNLALLGACLAMLALPTPWPWSVGGRRGMLAFRAARSA